MFRQYLDKIAGVEIYPMFSLIVFFVFFISLIWYVKKADKNEIEFLSKLPLSNQDESENK